MMNSHHSRVVALIWFLGALVIGAIIVSQILNNLAFQESRAQRTELRKALCKVDVMSPTEYCRLVREKEGTP